MKVRGNIISNNLTTREMEIIRCIAKGLTNKEIGQELYISKHTVKTHISTILLKLESRNRAAAVYIALKRKIID